METETTAEPISDTPPVKIEPQPGSFLDGVIENLSDIWRGISANPTVGFVLLFAAVAIVAVSVGYFARKNAVELRRTWKIILREQAQRISVSALAATIAWLLADFLGSAVPVFAALAALLTVQLSLGGSVKLAIQTVIGTAAALVIAEVAVLNFGTGPVTILAVVIAALLVGRLLNLGKDGGLWVATTALFATALGQALDEVVAMDRIIVIIAGSIIGVSLSVFAQPSTPLAGARRSLQELADDIASVVERSSESDLSVKQRRELVDAARETLASLDKVQTKVNEAVDTLKLYPSKNGKKIDALTHNLKALTLAAQQAYALTQDLLDARRSGYELPPRANEAMQAAGTLLSAYPSGHNMTQALEKVAVAQQYAAAELRVLDDTKALALAGSVLLDVAQLVSDADSRRNETSDTLPMAPVRYKPHVAARVNDDPVPAFAQEDLLEKLEREGWFAAPIPRNDSRGGDTP